jgi:amino acid transporter
MKMHNSGKLHLRELVSIGIGGMIGGGIFAVLGLSLQLAGTASFLAFLLAGLIALLTGYSYAKLSVEYPSKGGTAEFLAKGIRKQLLLGTLVMLLIASYTIMISLYAYAFGAYAAGAAGKASAYMIRLLGTSAILIFVIVNALGALVSGELEDALVVFKLGILLLVALLGLRYANLSRISPATWPPMLRTLTGGLIIFLAYEGFELISHASSDSEKLKDVEKAFYISILAVIAIYVLIALISSTVLSPKDVIKFRDYALAILVKRELGIVGFWLVVAAALASTASAINATLFGTAGISYIVAKLGELPESLGRHVWREAPEGLFIIAGISIVLLWSLNLKEISFAGSAAFLTIFLAINYTAFKLSEKIGAKKILPLLGMLLNLGALAVMGYYSLLKDPRQVLIFITIILLSAIIEKLYRILSRREIKEFLDKHLEQRHSFLSFWKEKMLQIKEFLIKNKLAKDVLVPRTLVEESRLEKPEIEILVIATPEAKLSEEDLHRAMVANNLVDRRLPIRIKVLKSLDEKLFKEFVKL